MLQAVFVGRHFEVSVGLLLGVVVALAVLAEAIGQTLRRAGTHSMLARDGKAPLDIDRFLDFASECLLLRKGTDGYIFVHRLLMEYFASLNPMDAQVARNGQSRDMVQKPA